MDLSWKNPSEQQLAAFDRAAAALGLTKKDKEWFEEDPTRHAMFVSFSSLGRVFAVDAGNYRGPAHRTTPHDLAEMMMMADTSLWYTQAKMWAETGEMSGAATDTGTQEVIKLAAGGIVKIVDWGYQDGKWWDLEAIWPDSSERALAVAAIVELCCMSRRVSRHTLAVHSSLFTYLPRLVMPKLNARKAEELLQRGAAGAAVLIKELQAQFDPEFRKKWNKAKRAAREEVSRTYEPTECIHPECSNQVAPPGIKPRDGHFKNYRSTGACQRGHNSYWCDKCEKPHSFVSKVGKTHREKHYGGDLTAELKQEKEEWLQTR